MTRLLAYFKHRHPWTSTAEMKAGLSFQGAPRLLRQIDQLMRRPVRWGATVLLPILVLVHPADGRRLLEGVDDRLRCARGVGIPWCRVGGGRWIRDQDAAVDDVRNFLDEIVTQLSSPNFRRVRTLRFPRYCLSRWAWQLVASGRPQVDPDHAWSSAGGRLRAFIRGRSTLIGDLERIHREVAQDLPWWTRTLLALLPSVGVWLTARLWAPLRWLGERHLEGSHSIADLVTRVTCLTERKDADLDAWKNVLVGALLEDLRAAYRRTTVLGAGRRRTTHCVLLLGNADEGSVGREFVDRMDAELRGADRSHNSPLLVICTSATSLDGARHGTGAEWSVDNVRTAMTEWGRAAAVEHHPRVLQLAVPKGAAPSGILDELQDTWLPVGRRPCTRWLAGALVLVAAFSLYKVGYDQCGAVPGEPSLYRESLPGGRTQCIGLSKGRYRFFDDMSDVVGLDGATRNGLRDIERAILEANDRSAGRPGHVTIVYLSTLTLADPAGYRNELEHLRGLSMMQGKMPRPVRILLANAGDQMLYGRQAAESVAEAAERDPTIVAVVGLGISTTGTEEAIKWLAGLRDGGRDVEPRMPMIGTALSATDIAENTTQYYHQVGPTNRREAAVVADFARRKLNVDKVTIYYSGDPADRYSRDLRNQAVDAFRKQGADVQDKPYRAGPQAIGVEIPLLAQQACHARDRAVFYAGRAERLASFFAALKNACAEGYPVVLAGDDVSRYVLDSGLRGFPDLNVYYASFASSLVWGDCRAALSRVAFFTEYARIAGDPCAAARDGTAILSYDAMLTLARALENTGVGSEAPLSRDKLLGGIQDIGARPGADPLPAVSGLIDFSSGEASPRDKAVLLLQATGAADNLAEVQLVGLCGRHGDAVLPADNELACGGM